ncbi:MAG: serine/threonine-protein kinase [Candidatus Xenobia bacterium]
MTDVFTDEHVLLPPGGSIDGFVVRRLLKAGGTTVFLQVEGQDGLGGCMQVPNKDLVNDYTLRRRFEREVEILRLLSGPGYPSLIAAGSYHVQDVVEIPYIVTTLPRGRTLAERRQDMLRHDQEPDIPFNLRLLLRLTRLLQDLHARGVVHRNLKPENIVVADDEAVQILDFVLGIGRGRRTLTEEGNFLGTARYVAPEQITGAHYVDGRADLYSLGLIIYEGVTHGHPFGTAPGTHIQEALKHLTSEPGPPSAQNPAVPKELDELLARLLRVDAEARYAHAPELEDDILRLFPQLRDLDR